MAQLNDKELDILHDKLLENGLTYEPLIDDLIDHLACSIEHKIDNGSLFKEALKESLLEFSEEEIQNTQENTIYLLTLKSNKMKKVIGITGIIISIFIILGVVFKKMHWLGAGVLLVIGLSLLSLILFPLMASIDYKSSKSKLQKATILTGYLSAIIISLATLFKTMHWPYGTILSQLGLGLLLLGFLPLYSYKNYNMAENKLFALSKVFIIIAGVIVFWGILPFVL